MGEGHCSRFAYLNRGIVNQASLQGNILLFPTEGRGGGGGHTSRSDRTPSFSAKYASKQNSVPCRPQAQASPAARPPGRLEFIPYDGIASSAASFVFTRFSDFALGTNLHGTPYFLCYCLLYSIHKGGSLSRYSTVQCSTRSPSSQVFPYSELPWRLRGDGVLMATACRGR